MLTKYRIADAIEALAVFRHAVVNTEETVRATRKTIAEAHAAIAKADAILAHAVHRSKSDPLMSASGQKQTSRTLLGDVR